LDNAASEQVLMICTTVHSCPSSSSSSSWKWGCNMSRSL